MTDSRFVVIEGAGPGQLREAALAEARRYGRPVAAWDGARAGVVCTGLVTDDETAQLAVLAAVSGAAVVAGACAARDVIDRLCDDLRRLGSLDHRVGLGPPLDSDQRDLLELLMGGASLGEAAAALHLSRRTADRRVAAARSVLGAASTAEALSAAARAGLHPRSLRTHGDGASAQ